MSTHDQADFDVGQAVLEIASRRRVWIERFTFGQAVVNHGDDSGERFTIPISGLMPYNKGDFFEGAPVFVCSANADAHGKKGYLRGFEGETDDLGQLWRVELATGGERRISSSHMFLIDERIQDLVVANGLYGYLLANSTSADGSTVTVILLAERGTVDLSAAWLGTDNDRLLHPEVLAAKVNSLTDQLEQAKSKAHLKVEELRNDLEVKSRRIETLELDKKEWKLDQARLQSRLDEANEELTLQAKKAKALVDERDHKARLLSSAAQSADVQKTLEVSLRNDLDEANLRIERWQQMALALAKHVSPEDQLREAVQLMLDQQQEGY